MTGAQALLRLESMGYFFKLHPVGRITATFPGGFMPPDEAEGLLNDLRADKPSAVHLLQQRAQGASVAYMEDQTTRSTDYADIKPLKYAQNAGDIEVKRIIYHRKSGIIEAIWRPLVPLPFLDLDKYKRLNVPPEGG